MLWRKLRTPAVVLAILAFVAMGILRLEDYGKRRALVSSAQSSAYHCLYFLQMIESMPQNECRGESCHSWRIFLGNGIPGQLPAGYTLKDSWRTAENQNTFDSAHTWLCVSHTRRAKVLSCQAYADEPLDLTAPNQLLFAVTLDSNIVWNQPGDLPRGWTNSDRIPMTDGTETEIVAIGFSDGLALAVYHPISETDFRNMVNGGEIAAVTRDRLLSKGVLRKN